VVAGAAGVLAVPPAGVAVAVAVPPPLQPTRVSMAIPMSRNDFKRMFQSSLEIMEDILSPRERSFFIQRQRARFFAKRPPFDPFST
jgi:hypothetical protein